MSAGRAVQLRVQRQDPVQSGPEIQPSDPLFGDFLSLKYGGPVDDLLASVLQKPLSDLVNRPCKKIRGRLVSIGYEIARSGLEPSEEKRMACQQLTRAIEYLHAGSLAVDDVQDGSKMRRGFPSLHLTYGLPTALNVGNLLYFWPLELIRQLNLNPEKETLLYRTYHRTLLRAHIGQALDVGVAVETLPQSRVFDLCLSAMELKSGALMALALTMGAIIGDAPPALLQAIDEFGHGFGIGLQMFDDIGNLKGTVEPAKRWEDLILRRPTWVWGCAAKHCSQDRYDQFVSAVKCLPNDLHLQRWMEQNQFLHRAVQEAQLHFAGCLSRFKNFFPPSLNRHAELQKLRELADEVSKAYE